MTSTASGDELAAGRDGSDDWDDRRWQEILDAAEGLLDALRDSANRLSLAEGRADRALEMRANGASFRQIIETAERPLLMEIATMDLQAIAAAGTRLRRVTVRALRDEGMSNEEIAKVFGVSRQRVSRLLHADPDTPGPDWGKRPSP